MEFHLLYNLQGKKKKKPNKTNKIRQALCDEDVRSAEFLQIYLSCVTKPLPKSLVIRGGKELLNNVSLQVSTLAPPQILIRFMLMELSPLGKMQMEPLIVLCGERLAAGDIFVLLPVKTASQNSCCLWKWDNSAKWTKFRMHVYPGLAVIFLTHQKMLISDFGVL